MIRGNFDGVLAITQRWMFQSSDVKKDATFLYDRWLLLAVGCLIGLGLLMVASSSMVISMRQYDGAFHYFFRQAIYLGIGFFLAMIVLGIEIEYWKKCGTTLLLIAFVLLALVLIPGIGRQINGSMRWIGFGPLGFQVSEVCKFICIVYLAGYLVRHKREVLTQFSGFLKPMVLLSFIALLLLREPDFGAATVILTTSLGMMFLAGVRLWQFVLLLATVAMSLAALAIASPYRLMRVTTFLNPWANQFDSGYQLTQSLIAFGRGGWFGVGLGESIQKLFYLPEAHSDFILAVYAEELGLMGVLAIVVLFSILVGRALVIGYKAKQQGKDFAAYLAYGFGLWLGIQAMINLGVNIGILPTKGLTLPLISSGGSSIIVVCVAIALLLRIDYESRTHALQNPWNRI